LLLQLNINPKLMHHPNFKLFLSIKKIIGDPALPVVLALSSNKCNLVSNNALGTDLIVLISTLKLIQSTCNYFSDYLFECFAQLSFFARC
jgi:hypothetical protein